MSVERDAVAQWLDDYIAAWKSYDRDSILALFSDDVSYRYRPHGDEINGSDAVAASWLEDDPDEPDTYDADYQVIALDGDIAVAVGTSTYLTEAGGPVDKVFDNCFVMRFEADRRCVEFTEFFIERPHG